MTMNLVNLHTAPLWLQSTLHNEPPDPDDCRWFDYFEALAWQARAMVLILGTAAARDITGISFKPSFAWVKTRSPVGYVHR